MPGIWGIFSVAAEAKCPVSTVYLSVAPANIAIQIQHLGCLYCTAPCPRVRVGGSWLGMQVETPPGPSCMDHWVLESQISRWASAPAWSTVPPGSQGHPAAL